MPKSTSSTPPIKKEYATIQPKRSPPWADKDKHEHKYKDAAPDPASSQEKPFRDLTTEQKVLAIVRHSVQPFSDRLDPFAALPVSLDRLQEHLVSFYLLYYPKVTYGFSARLRPHLVASNFSIALTTPACFQVVLARSALYRISLNKYASEREKETLELTVMRHKGEALRMVRALSVASSPRRKDDLLASMISLGTFDQRTGSKDAAGMHYSAVRRILRATGGPLAVQSVLLSRVMCFFECIYGTSPESYVWDDAPDLVRLLDGLSGFLAQLWEFWQSLSTINALASRLSKSRGPTPVHSFGLRPGSALLSLVERQPAPDAEQTQPRRLELIFQLTCLLTLGAVTVDLADDVRALQAYMDGLRRQMDRLQLAGQSCNNAMWQMQVNDHSHAHSRRIWRAASYVWVLKHVSYDVQLSLKRWLLAFLKGRPVATNVFRLDAFHFSYAQ